MYFDRTCTDIQLPADLLICSSIRQQLKNFLLPTTQGVDRQTASGLFSLDHGLLRKTDHPRGNHAKYLADFLGGEILGKNALNALADVEVEYLIRRFSLHHHDR